MEDVKIVAEVIKGKRRSSALPKYFASDFAIMEHSIFSLMEMLCESYNGGYWEFVALDNECFFMYPSSDQNFVLHGFANGNEGSVSAEAAGIVVCLYAYNHRANSRSVSASVSNHYCDLFYKLRDYALQHPESSMILKLID